MILERAVHPIHERFHLLSKPVEFLVIISRKPFVHAVKNALPGKLLTRAVPGDNDSHMRTLVAWARRSEAWTELHAAGRLHAMSPQTARRLRIKGPVANRPPPLSTNY
jgi:hypothetical protein